MIKSLYQNFIKDGNKKAARQLIKEVLEQNKGNVSKTARQLGISRKTVRRARDGTPQDLSRAPKKPSKKIEDWEAIAILAEAMDKKKFGYRQLTKHFKNTYGIKFPLLRVKYILKKAGFSPSKRRRKGGSGTPLYHYERLLPFQEIQIDTKI